MKTFLFYNFLFLIFLVSCNSKDQENKSINKEQIIEEVKSTEQTLFQLLKNGKIDQAFALHNNSSVYKNISEGYARTYEQMDSTLKANSLKGIKTYDYEFTNRDFMVIDENNALETLEGDKILKGNADSIIEKKGIIMSLLWTKANTKWVLNYLHSSYKN